MITFNYLAVGLAGLIPLLFGSIWYLPGVMGKSLERIEGIDKSESHSHPSYVYVLTLIYGILISLMLSAIIGSHSTEEITLFLGLLLGSLAALLIGTPPLIIIALFDNKPLPYILIHSAYWLISMTIMGGIIGFIGVS